MIVDLFAGPGGWDLAAKWLDMETMGIEWDRSACQTREAADLWTTCADVSELDPADYAPCEGLIASPPCPAFSMAGKRLGLLDLPMIWEVTRDLALGYERHARHALCHDPTSLLVTEPIRWALDLRPNWIACEQVPAVLPYWEFCAELLELAGYHVWTGLLSTERYGVPQTRKRAILIASREHPVSEPPATHARFIPARKVVHHEGQDSLFAAIDATDPAPQRITLPEDRELEPWISMAEALGWGGAVQMRNNKQSNAAVRDVEEPAPTITGSHDFAERRWELRNGNQENAAVRDQDEPAPTVAFGHNAARVERVFRNGTRENRAERSEDEPAPTLHFGGRSNDVSWVEAEPAMVDTGNTKGGTRPEGLARSADTPARAITSRADQLEKRGGWPEERPSTTVAGDPRVPPPGYRGGRADYEKGIVKRAYSPTVDAETGEPIEHDWPSERPASTVWTDPRVAGPGHKKDAASPDSPGRMEEAVRVSLSEAAVLQGFPPDYPFVGTKSKRFQQVGNAVPPPLARVVLLEATGL